MVNKCFDMVLIYVCDQVHIVYNIVNYQKLDLRKRFIQWFHDLAYVCLHSIQFCTLLK